jgi:inorganic pyrophosphatase
MTTPQQEFLQTHAPDGVMTPQQAAQFLELAQGDTGTTPGSVTPDAEPVADANTPESAEPAPVILAKDGVHTIPFEKLAEAREAEKHWKAQAEARETELQALRAEAQARADAGQAPTKTDNAVAAATAAIESGADPEIFGDFSEAALAAGINKLVAAKVEEMTAGMRAQLEQTMAPFQAKQAIDAQAAHYGAIYAKHPDADSIAESKELADWIAAQPSFARKGYESVLAKGSTAEIVEFFDTFKAATGRAQATAPQADVKAAAKALIARAAVPVPASLSDIPGGHAGPAGKHEALSKLSPIQQAEALADMSQDQRDAYLNRRM